MEDVLDVYSRPYDAKHPVICMDEKPYQLLGEVRDPLPMRPGSDLKLDSEYVRKGTCSIFMFNEPLAGWRHTCVREHRTANDWAEEIQYLVNSRPDAEKIVLVMDNLNTHALASLYKRVCPQRSTKDCVQAGNSLYTQARQLVRYGRDRAQRLDTPVSCAKNRRYRNTKEPTLCLGV